MLWRHCTIITNKDRFSLKKKKIWKECVSSPLELHTREPGTVITILQSSPGDGCWLSAVMVTIVCDQLALDASSISCCQHLKRWISKSLRCRLSENACMTYWSMSASYWACEGIICSPRAGLKLINDAAWKDLFRVQWDKLSQIDSDDHMSAGYRDILPGPRLYVSEKLYPTSWWRSFFSLMRLLHTPL